MTLGITPTYPATGYGYIKKGIGIGVYQEVEAYQALRFTEKPDLPEAEQMLSSGDFAWNSGMFIWKTETILKEISRQMPDLDSRLALITEAWDTPERDKVTRQVWPEIKPQTIDFGIMENAQNVAVIPASDLEWNDVGSWEALFDLLPVDENGNIIKGTDHLSLDTSGTIVYVAGKPRAVVTIGVDDLIIVDTGDVLLVCDRNQAQDVRQAVKLLKESGQTDLI